MKKLFCVLTIFCLFASIMAVGTMSAAAIKEQDEQILVDAEPTATETAAKSVILGDANDDGVVNMKDVLTLRALLCGHINFVEAENVWIYWDHHPEHSKKIVTINKTNTDANVDGECNMKDVLAVRKYLAGIIDTLA